MNQLIEEYLGQHNYCPLPGIGTLTVKEKSAHIHLGENRISPPSDAISLHLEETNSKGFVDFISARKDISASSADSLLSEFCSSLKKLPAGHEITLEHTGSFFVNESGNIEFRQKDANSLYRHEISLKKVIHTDAVHQVRVGDTETTTKRMNKYLHENPKVSISKWGLVLMIVSLFLVAAIVWYISNPDKKLVDPEYFNFYKSKT